MANVTKKLLVAAATNRITTIYTGNFVIATFALNLVTASHSAQLIAVVSACDIRHFSTCIAF